MGDEKTDTEKPVPTEHEEFQVGIQVMLHGCLDILNHQQLNYLFSSHLD